MSSCNELDCFAFLHVEMEGDKQDQCIVAYNNKDGWRFKSDHLVRFGNVPGAVEFPKEATKARTYLRLYGEDKDEVQEEQLNFDFYDDKIIPFDDSDPSYDFTGF